MNTKIIKTLFLVLVVMVTSCEIPDNIDPKRATIVTPDVLVTNSEIALFDLMGSINVNINITRLLAQYQSEVTYVTESQYNFQDRQLPDAHWGILYRDVLTNLEQAKSLINATSFVDPQEKANKTAIIEILEVYSYQLLLDAFGNVPYTEALKGAANSRPKYDDAKTVYLDVLSRLSKAVTDLSKDAGSAGFGSADVLYSSNISQWLQFGASLKLRFGLRLADFDPTLAATTVAEAVASGVFTDQSQSAIFHYTGVAPYVNSYYTEYILNNRKDFVPTSTLIDKMNGLNDPRRPVWFTLLDGNYVGITYAKPDKYKLYSHFTAIPDPVYPVIIMDYVEVEFLLAEAVERGMSGVTGTAADHYNTAIKESMLYWGVTEADADTYLAQTSVAYGTATGTWKQKIGDQKWLALFDRGNEAWAEWRRLDFPILTPPPGMVYGDIPVRMPFPYNENKMNEVNYAAAATAIGGDNASTKLFWDKY